MLDMRRQKCIFKLNQLKLLLSVHQLLLLFGVKSIFNTNF